MYSSINLQNIAPTINNHLSRTKHEVKDSNEHDSHSTRPKRRSAESHPLVSTSSAPWPAEVNHAKSTHFTTP